MGKGQPKCSTRKKAISIIDDLHAVEQGDKLGMGPLSLIQWSLSTRDKLGMGPLIVPYTVEPLYKGQERSSSSQS